MKNLLNRTALALPALMLSMPAWAEDAAPKIDSGDTAWMLTSTALVLMMTIPGLALFYAGMVRKKNILATMMQSFMITCLITVVWMVAGYSLAFTNGSAYIGDFSRVMLAGFGANWDKPFILGAGTESAVTQTVPESVFMMFQMTFAIITPGLMVGAFVERLKFTSFLLFTSLWSVFVYTPICHMVWGGGWLASMGVLDFAGGIVVHITAGVGALLTCAMLGPRKENKMTPHNLPMAITGAGMLWVGWYGFNGGSALAAGAAAASAVVVSQISAATAALVWMAADWRDGKPTSLGLITGSIAGLAAITPAAGFVGVPGVFAIGALSAAICRFCSTTVKAHFGYDDSLDVFGVHGMGGLVGTLALGVFGNVAFGGTLTVPIATQVSLQAFASAFTVVYTLVVSYVLLKITEALTGGLRVSVVTEAMGLDHTELGEEAYLTA